MTQVGGRPLPGIIFKNRPNELESPSPFFYKEGDIGEEIGISINGLRNALAGSNTTSPGDYKEFVFDYEPKKRSWLR